ncbi:mannitol dehydrogenase family protein [Nakamurella lactea]|uniref:mannitol dehydrogenase family protein n=1 Tax=Nakamurella lactea TaxID=459515 RepID=UPI0004019DE7|nr:mannitol dehydrogenase family protein [Nakamurella lactea]
MSNPQPLARCAGSPAAPVGIAHLGLGNFFRAHQAWYTGLAPDAAEWGIAAFTGRSAALADRMTAQDGLYTLVTKAATGNRFDVVSSVSLARPAADNDAWSTVLAAPSTRALTLTVTEAGYRRGADGDLDRGDPGVLSDLERLRADPTAAVTTVPGRLVAGLAARRRADAGPITVIPCDNLADNGSVVRQVVGSAAELLEPALARWIGESVSFVTSMVDRITPRGTAADSAEVAAATGRTDTCPVITEPFSEWVLCGDFPAGRPRWDAVGTEFVDDVGPFERRKLWLLNGAHSLLAYEGSIRGHVTVSEAMADDACRDWVQQWWAEALTHLPFPSAELTRYTDALTERFANRSIRHLLAQIAADGSQKLPIRVLPVLALERAAGRIPIAATRILAAWVVQLRGGTGGVTDPHAARLVELAAGPLHDAVTRILDRLDPAVGADATVVATVVAHAEELARQ